ncbi:MAG: hypothetical protein KGJ07_09475, partial [Patescibacteria group bacterium]|nr:hypothetical protein [Patescibacteria group bacterium]
TLTKELEDFTDSPLRVMFLFRCTNSKCKKQEWVYSDGEVRVSKPFLCPKCKKEAKMTHGKEGKKITWTTSCTSCGFTETTVDDFEKMDAEREQREKEEKDLLAKYREAFCLTDETGKKYLDSFNAIEFSSQVYEVEKQKHDTTAYQQVSQVKKLGIVELEKLLLDRLEKEKYIKLSFDRPEMGQFVTVGFVVQDADTSRRENISTSTLQKIIKEALENSNWRLMSDGIHYRLGYVYGKLKGYEREEDLLQLYGKKKETRPPADYEEKRSKYGGTTWVQLASMRAEQEVRDNARQERLKAEPEGFLLEADGYYNCKICYDGHYGNESWWNLDGIRCVDCWRNIKEGVIPSLKAHLFDNDDEWFTTSQLKSRYNVHPASAKKLRREGLLHGRDLKRASGSIYETVYLVSENKEFIKKYPPVKKEEDPRLMMLDIQGHAVQFGTYPPSEK